MVDEFSTMRLIPAGISEIHTSSTVESKDGCGLIPIGQPATRVETTGLKWDLGGDYGQMTMGGLVSTSNLIEKAMVTVDTDTPLVFTTTLQNTDI